MGGEELSCGSGTTHRHLCSKRQLRYARRVENDGQQFEVYPLGDLANGPTDIIRAVRFLPKSQMLGPLSRVVMLRVSEPEDEKERDQ